MGVGGHSNHDSSKIAKTAPAIIAADPAMLPLTARGPKPATKIKKPTPLGR
jgi:hypothetical protein